MKIPTIFNIRNIICRTKNNSQPKKSITNLTNELKKVHYNGVEFNTLFEEYPNLSRTVGSLPQKWGRKIGKSKEKRDAIDKVFSDFAKKFHKTNNKKALLPTENMQKKLSMILETPVTVQNLAAGEWGRTYKISVDSQDYVLKVFFNSSPEIYGSDLHCYGNYNELATAVYSSKHCADHFVTFYMGRFGEKQDGYLLTKFLPYSFGNIKEFNGLEENDPANFVFSTYLRKLICNDDSNSNIIAKKIIDFGNTDSTNASKLEPKIYKLAKRIGLYLDINNSKGIDEILACNKGDQSLASAIDFLQSLIDKYCYCENASILYKKRTLLDKLGLKIPRQ